eukprot:TRINITY_DN135801_c0_g1_i1.p1 TRINITY_DN135801_c0_g1~~TRINITY_DN135801_c0_g1_i1.p1  ORF type:complete len:1184 (-),score=101.28 TRINITY_DN135801_c0_g1_i1:28-3435(-)
MKDSSADNKNDWGKSKEEQKSAYFINSSTGPSLQLTLENPPTAEREALSQRLITYSSPEPSAPFIPSTTIQSFISKISNTTILHPYNGLLTRPPKEIYKIDSTDTGISKSVYKVYLTKGINLVLKVEIFPKKKERRTENLLREHFIGKTLGAASDYFTKSLDLKKIDSSNEQIRVELLSEYSGKSLDKIKIGSANFSEIAYQLTCALAEMEQYGISHLDIKPPNIAWSKAKQQLKIIDFGTSIQFYRDPERIEKPLQEYAERLVGITNEYAPPEVHEAIKRKVYDNIVPQKADVFAVGITLSNILFKSKGKVLPEVIIDNEEMLKWLLAKIDEIASADWMKIVKKCLEYKHEDRPTFVELKQMLERDLKINIKKPKSDNSHPLQTSQEAYVVNVWKMEKILTDLRQDPKQNTMEMAITLYELGVQYNYLLETSKSICCLKECSSILKYYYGGMHWYTEEVLTSLGLAYFKADDYENAMKSYKKALRIARKCFGEFSPSVIEINTHMGDAYTRLKGPKAGVKYYLRAKEIAIKAQTNPPSFEEYINRLINRALVSEAKPIESIKHYKEEERMLRQIYSEDDLALVGTYKKLGLLHEKIADKTTALQYYQRTLQILLTNHGEDHPEVGYIYSIIGNLHSDICKFEIAHKYYEKARRVLFKVFGETSTKVVGIYECFGELYSRLGRHEYSLEEYQKALQICQDNYGPENLPAAQMQTYVAKEYDYLKRYKQAMKYCEMAEKTIKKLGANNISYYAVVSLVEAKIWNHLRKYRDALECCSEARNVLFKLYEADSPVFQDVHTLTGDSYAGLDEVEVALEYYERAAQIVKSGKGEKHVDMIELGEKLGNMHMELGEYEEAIEEYKRALSIMRKYYKSDAHPEIARIKQSIYDSYISLNNTEAAEAYYQPPEEPTSPTETIHHADPGMAYYNEGQNFECVGDYCAALGCYLTAYPLLVQMYGKRHHDIGLIKNSIGSMYEKLGDPRTAIEWHKEAASIMTELYGDFDLEVAKIYSKLANAYYGLHLCYEALECRFKEVQILKKVLGEHDENLITAYYGIMYIYRTLGQRDKVEEYYKKITDIAGKGYGSHGTKQKCAMHEYLQDKINNYDQEHSIILIHCQLFTQLFIKCQSQRGFWGVSF